MRILLMLRGYVDNFLMLWMHAKDPATLFEQYNEHGKLLRSGWNKIKEDKTNRFMFISGFSGIASGRIFGHLSFDFRIVLGQIFERYFRQKSQEKMTNIDSI